MTDGIGEQFQQDTKYHPDRMPRSGIDPSARPEPYKSYYGAKIVALPAPADPGASLHQAIQSRRSIRRYAAKPISLEQLSYLLWASTGIERKERGCEFRTAPSAGALYPIETYLVVNNVDGLASGLYHYSIREHALEEIRLGELGDAISDAALGQEMCAQAAVVFVWTAIIQRTRWKYGQRAYRYIYLDAGHVAENLALAAVGLGLGTCQIGALFDDEVNRLIGVDGVEETILYMTSVGWPASVLQ